jgi:hypothetical protein
MIRFVVTALAVLCGFAFLAGYFTGGSAMFLTFPALFPFITAGSTVFWLLLVCGFLAIGWIVEEEEFVWAVLTFVGLLIFLQLCTTLGALAYLRHNPFKLLVAFGVYVGIGIIWSFCKWFIYLHDENERIHADYNWLFARLTDTIKLGDIDKINEYKKDIKDKIPTALRNKERITGWTAFWPWSMTWFFFSDLIRKLYKRIFQFFQEVYENMAKRVFKDMYDLIK